MTEAEGLTGVALALSRAACSSASRSRCSLISFSIMLSLGGTAWGERAALLANVGAEEVVSEAVGLAVAEELDLAVTLSLFCTADEVEDDEDVDANAAGATLVDWACERVAVEAAVALGAVDWA